MTGRPPSTEAAWPSGAVAGYGLGVLVAAIVFATIDREILLLVTEPLKRALGMTDTQIGELNGVGLSLIAALATFPLGWLADRIDRRMLLAACVLVWAAATAGCAFSRNFGQLFLSSVFVAVGEAVLGPVTYSIIPDLFPPHRRVAANYVFFVASILGTSSGLLLSGEVIAVIDSYRASWSALSPTFDTWRVAVLAVALPGPLLAVMIGMMRLRRTHVLAKDAQAVGLLSYFMTHARTLLGIFVGLGFFASAAGGLGTWAPVMLMRLLHESPAQVGVRLGLAVTIASVAGVVLSGRLLRTLSPRIGVMTPLRMAQAGAALSLLMAPLLFAARSPAVAYVILATVQGVTTMGLSLSPTLLQDVAPASLRGRLIALGGLAYTTLLSAGPVLTGIVSDHLAHVADGLVVAMVAVSTTGFLFGVLTLQWSARTLPGSMAAAQE